MKVLFEFSRGGIPDNLEYLNFIRNFLLKQGYKLTNDLLKDSEKTIEILPENVFSILQKAISQTDCVIIEGSVVSLSLGYVLTESINLGKPVLFLVSSSMADSKNRFVSSIQSKLLTSYIYSGIADLESQLDNFCTSNRFIRTRFNLVLPNSTNSFITEASREMGISKTEYILDLINQKMKSRENDT